VVDAFPTWQRIVPHASWLGGPLAAIAEELESPATRAELARCERDEEYSEPVVARLDALGLADLFAGGACTTACHIQSLNAIAAQASASLAVSLGITGLALLPAWLAATPDQLARVGARVAAGARAAMLLSEWATGSNLTGTQTRAERLEGGEEYALFGEKQLINLARRADLFMTLVRTAPPGPGPLGATAGLSLFLVERADGVELLPRWRTLPVPAADIGGVRFDGTRVAAAARIGAEGDGFRLVQAALTLSRGGIAAFASGTASRAAALALAHARERAPYGEPIVRLDAVAQHLVRAAALDLACACIAIKAAAAANALGPRAAYHTAVGKLVACDLAERAVAEGRAVLGARALLSDLPYQQVVRDVMLYGVFDGTRHVMLEHVLWRVRQMVRGGEETGAAAGDPDIYDVPPAPLVEATRRRGRAWLPRPAAVAAELGDGAVDAAPLAEGARALEAALAALPDDALAEQSTGFALAGAWAELEAAVAICELGDPARRAHRGMPAPAAAPFEAADLARFAVADVAGDALAAARRALAGCGVGLDCAPAERALALSRAEAGRRLRAALRQ
jgi:alkylation response protein AidB-like acyl-CoA dehydrogenase